MFNSIRYSGIGFVISLLITGCAGKLEFDSRFDSNLDLSGTSLGIETSKHFAVDTDLEIIAVPLKQADYEIVTPVVIAENKSEPKIRIDGNGYPVLVLQEEFSEAWEEIVSAVNSSRLTVSDQDRTLGIVYLGSIKGDIFNSSTAFKKKSVSRYQLAVVKTFSGIEVSVQFDAEQLADIESSNDILNEIFQQLSS